MVWDVGSGKVVRKLEDDQGARSLSVTSDGQRALTGSSTGAIKLWDLTSGKVARTLDEGEPTTSTGSFVSSIVYLPDNRHALISCEGLRLWLWDIVSGQRVRFFKW